MIGNMVRCAICFAAIMAASTSVRAADPSSGAASEFRSMLPDVGDSWTYNIRDASRPEDNFNLRVEIQASSQSSVRELLLREGVPPSSLNHAAGPELRGIAPGVAIFSPYLLSLGGVREGQRWQSVPSKMLWECDTIFECWFSARIAEKEHVTVKAGTFEAWRVVIDMRVAGQTGRGAGQFIYWYADEARRIVKFQSRVNAHPLSGSAIGWMQPDIDMELVSFSRARR